MFWRTCCPTSVEVNDHLNDRGCWVVHDDDSKALVRPRFASQVVVQLGIDALGHGTGVGEEPSPTGEGEKHLGHVSYWGQFQMFVNTLPLLRHLQ